MIAEFHSLDDTKHSVCAVCADCAIVELRSRSVIFHGRHEFGSGIDWAQHVSMLGEAVVLDPGEGRWFWRYESTHVYPSQTSPRL